MNYGEFSELCEREWREGGGDVIALNLPDDEYIQLVHSIMTREYCAPLFLGMREDELAGVRGARLHHLVNPATRSTVRVKAGAGSGAAEITWRWTRKTEKENTVPSDAAEAAVSRV